MQPVPDIPSAPELSRYIVRLAQTDIAAGRYLLHEGMLLLTVTVPWFLLAGGAEKSHPKLTGWGPRCRLL